MMNVLFVFALIFVSAIAVEEPDVVVLTADNFDDFIKNDFALVEFYAPWCGHCKSLAPEYSAAATTLKESESPVKLGKVDATVEKVLGERFSIRGYPTLKFFRKGVATEYDGGRTAIDIVNWLNKKSGPPSKTLTTQEEIDSFVKGTGTRGVAYVSDNEEVWNTVASSNSLQSFTFAHIKDSSLFGSNKAGTVVLHKDGESPLTFDGDFTADELNKWFLSEGFPLVDELAQESWTRAQKGAQDLLAVFYQKDDAETAEAALTVAKEFKGDLIVTSSDQIGIGSRWGASGNVVPTVIYVNNKVLKGGSPTFTVWNEESSEKINAETLKAFVSGSRDGTYESFVKSEPIPENNDGPVTILVGKNFEQIAHQNKDVLVEFYAPWCGHCKKLAPIFDELGEAFKGDDNVVIAKMDSTANATPKSVSITGYPTLILFDADNKQVTFNEAERDLETLTKWIEKNRVSKPSGKSEL
jgi:protein disulfide-isomerase A1